MNRNELIAALNVLGIDLRSVEMKVLAAITKIRDSLSKTTTIDGIYEEISETEKVTKNWVYKVVSKLIQDEFVKIDKIRRPHLFLSSEKQVIRGITKKRETQLQALDEQIRRIERDIDILESTRDRDLFAYITGEKFEQRPVTDPAIVEGVFQVEIAAVENIFRLAEKGDNVRIMTTMTAIPPDPDKAGLIEKEIVNAGKRGALIQILMTRSSNEDGRLNTLGTFLRSLRADVIEAIENGNLELYFYPEPRKTYRFYALNGERMVMYISDLYRPETSIVLTRSSMPALFNGAMETFERLKAESHYMNDALYELMKTRSV